MEKKEKKEVNIEKIVQCGTYKPLCIKKGKKIEKWDYDRDAYCEIMREAAKQYNEYAENKADFLVSFAQDAYGLWDDDEYWEKFGYKEDEQNVNPEERKRREKALNTERGRLIRDIDRKHNRILKGMNGNSNKVAPDKSCYHYLEKVQSIFDKPLLTKIRDDLPFYYENKYLYSLTIQLIEIMYATDIFNYVPNSSNFQRTCYKNHLNMIKNNVEEIYGHESEIYIKWMEILAPFQQLIFECSYPGIKSGDIWHCKCEELRFFDCSYEIAKNFELYSKVKHRLKFDLGNTREEVNCELKACKLFFSKNEQTEKELFCEKMLCTLKKIVYEEFGLEV